MTRAAHTRSIRPRPTRARRRAFTLAELSMAIFIVGVGFVACVRALPVLLKTAAAEKQTLIAQQLAGDLAAEIALLPFENPTSSSTTLGPDSGESGTNRSLFDDIDDYAGWSKSPPDNKDGTPAANGTGYTRSVAVVYVLPTDFNTVSTAPTDAKRITITVTKPGIQPAVITLVRLRNANREDSGSTP